MSNSIQINNITPHTAGGTVTVNNLTVSGSTALTLVASASYAPTASYAGNLPRYKTYVAKLSQTGSQNPTAVTVTNTLGFEPTWSRIQTGVYYFNFSESVNYSRLVTSISPNSQNNLLSTTAVNATTYSLVDNTFPPNADINGFNGSVFSLALQSDEKIIAGGEFSTYYGTSSYYIARLNTDGTYDTTFNVGSGFNDTVLTLAAQSDGKVIVGGSFTSYSGIPSGRIARLNVDGTYNNTFNVGSGFNNAVRALAIQSDGKIIVGGQFTNYNGTGSSYIARLNTDGIYDNIFNIGTGFDLDVFALAIQSDGKIIVGGDFSTYNGTGSNFITRLNTDGTYDNTFSIGTGFDNYVLSLAIQPDGKILVGGGFNNYDGTGSACIARLNTDGTYDTTFNVGTGFSDIVKSLSIQPDGKVVAGGAFLDYDLTGSIHIARLNTDGTYDTTFNVGSGFDGEMYTTLIQPDRKILVGGAFTTPAYRISRLNPFYDVTVVSTNSAGNTLDGTLNDTTVGVTLYS